MRKVMLMGFLMMANTFCMEERNERYDTFQEENSPKVKNEISCSFRSRCIERHKEKLLYGAGGSILGFLIMLLIHFETQKTC